MLLYHYSKDRFSILKTLEKQRKIKSDEVHKAHEDFLDFEKKYGIQRPGYYYEHISFFFEKIPLNLYKYFPKDHSVWVKGNSLYEYTVDSKSIKHFGYELVETPEKIKLYYNNDITLDEYFKRMGMLYERERYIGKDNDMFEKVVKYNKLAEVQNNYFILLKDRPNYNEIKDKYAATVPHVMIYPVLGEIKPVEIKQIILE